LGADGRKSVQALSAPDHPGYLRRSEPFDISEDEHLTAHGLERVDRLLEPGSFAAP
jgi:hypothetical protein